MIFPLATEATLSTGPHHVQEFIFGSPNWLWALIPFALLLLLRRRKGAVASLAHPTIRFVAPYLNTPFTLAGRIGPFLLTLAGMALIVALARPQWLHKHEEQLVSGIDIMVACDLSGSMVAQDMVFATQDDRGRRRNVVVNRLTAAKHVINEFVAGRPNDRIGLVAFAGKAKLCSPLTLDHAIVRHIIEQFYLASRDPFGRGIRPGYMEEDGTAIGTAIASAATRLDERHDTKSKIIILVTDGANNRGTISPIEAARQAAALGIKIFTIAIGKDDRISSHTADVDTFDEKTLQEIAELTGGRFYRASSGTRLMKAFESIDKLEKTKAKRRTFISYDELYAYPLSVAIALILLSLSISLLRPRFAP